MSLPVLSVDDPVPLAKQCLDRRIPDRPQLRREVEAWADRCNLEGQTVEWTFAKEEAEISSNGTIMTYKNLVEKPLRSDNYDRQAKRAIRLGTRRI